MLPLPAGAGHLTAGSHTALPGLCTLRAPARAPLTLGYKLGPSMCSRLCRGTIAVAGCGTISITWLADLLLFLATSQKFWFKKPFPTPSWEAQFPGGYGPGVLVPGALARLLAGGHGWETPLAGRHGWKGQTVCAGDRLFGIWNNASLFYLLSFPACFSLSCTEIPAAPPTTAASSTEEPAGMLSLLLKHLDGKCLLSNRLPDMKLY